jgi:hypothetical protein
MFEQFTTSRAATAGAKIHRHQGGRGLPGLQGGPEAPAIGDPLAIWGNEAVEVTGQALPCGHFLSEDALEETLAALEAFLEG